ncbi:MAG TPA: hypothetical protein VI603_04270 [Saprospiraceae bacterium]|nr:hypothetical protein [Saprospiraceae bacterium]
MKFKRMLIPVLVMNILFSCKQEATTSETTSSEGDTTALSSPSTENPNLVANMPWTFLTHQLFRHHVTVTSGKIDPEERKGHWIDFLENGKYDYGVWGDKTQEGTWSYDDQTKLLELKPSGNENPSEWRVMHKDNNLILIGTATYGNNPQQVQWIRHEGRPDKNVKPAEDEDQ